MFLKEITIKSLLSFGPKGVTLSLRPLNVLIGPNGSGKSNFVDVIRLLQAAPSDIWKPITSGSGPSSWAHQLEAKLSSEAASATTELSAKILPFAEFSSSTTLTYSLRILFFSLPFLKTSPDQGRTPGYLQDERLEMSMPDQGEMRSLLFVRNEREAKYFNTDKAALVNAPKPDLLTRDKTFLSQLIGAFGDPNVIVAGHLLSSVAIYGYWMSGRYTSLRVPQRRVGSGATVFADYSNLAIAVREIDSDTAMRIRFLELAKMLFDGVTRVFVEDIGDEFCQIVVEEGVRKTPMSRMSDGSLRFISLLAILLSPSPPPLVCIEEPEIGLHPDLIVVVADLLKEASTRMQLIVTTHSDMLLDALSDTPESIVVCSKEEGETVMTRLDAEELRPYLEEQTLSSLWSSGQLGGRRW